MAGAEDLGEPQRLLLVARETLAERAGVQGVGRYIEWFLGDGFA